MSPFGACSLKIGLYNAQTSVHEDIAYFERRYSMEECQMDTETEVVEYKWRVHIIGEETCELYADLSSECFHQYGG